MANLRERHQTEQTNGEAPSASITFLESEVAECDSITLELRMQKRSLENEINGLVAQARQKIATVEAQIESVKQKRVGYTRALEELKA